MTSAKYLPALFLLAFSGFLAGCDNAPSAKETSAKPNILFILADDLGYADIGAFGGEIDTPYLNALAGNSRIMSNFYAAPVCSPTRAMLMSGSASHLAGLGKMEESWPEPYHRGQPGYEGYLRGNVATLPQLLRDAGYGTMMTGKWHLGREMDQSPAARGFDRSFALTPGYGDHFGKPTFTPLPVLDEVAPGPEYREDGKAVYGLPDDFYSSNYYAERMIGYLEENRQNKKPFFAYLAFTAPHWPLQAPKSYIAKYRGKYDKGYDVLRRERFERMKEMGHIAPHVTLPPRPAAIASWESLAEKEQARQARMMETYAGMVDNMDANIGRVIEYLQRSGQYDNTIIIFMSDNGADATREDKSWLAGTIARYDNSLENIGNRNSFVVYGPGWARAGAVHLREFKGSAFEGGIHVPALIRLPQNRDAGRVLSPVLTVSDWLPTLLDLAGGQHPGEMYQGRSVIPVRGLSFANLLSGDGVETKRDNITAWELDNDRAIRKGDWKLVYISKFYGQRINIPAGWQLYNLKDDPSELHDLSQAEPEKKKELLAAWNEYVAKNNVILPPEEHK